MINQDLADRVNALLSENRHQLAFIKLIVNNRKGDPVACEYIDIQSVEVDSDGSIFIKGISNQVVQ